MEKKKDWEFIFNSWHLTEISEYSGKGFHFSEIIIHFVFTTVEIKYERSNARSLLHNENRSETVSRHFSRSKAILCHLR